jgi:hypothetical protein
MAKLTRGRALSRFERKPLKFKEGGEDLVGVHEMAPAIVAVRTDNVNPLGAVLICFGSHPVIFIAVRAGIRK